MFPNKPTVFTGPCAVKPFQCPNWGPNAGQFYPGADPAHCGTSPGQTLSDLNLTLQGGGIMNFATTSTPDSMNDFSTTPIYLHDLFCSGFSYALIDVSAVWCGNCQAEAAQLPSLYPSWLDAGGVVFSILAQSDNPVDAATEDDLAAWIATYGTPYPITLDSDKASAHYFGVGSGFPYIRIFDLSNMQVLYPGDGNDPAYYQEFCQVLGVTSCPSQ